MIISHFLYLYGLIVSAKLLERLLKIVTARLFFVLLPTALGRSEIIPPRLAIETVIPVPAGAFLPLHQPRAAIIGDGAIGQGTGRAWPGKLVDDMIDDDFAFLIQWSDHEG